MKTPSFTQRIVCAHITRTDPQHYRVFITRAGHSSPESYRGSLAPSPKQKLLRVGAAGAAPHEVAAHQARPVAPVFTIGSIVPSHALQSIRAVAVSCDAQRAAEADALVSLAGSLS